jgi:hypothetical protein
VVLGKRFLVTTLAALRLKEIWMIVECRLDLLLKGERERERNERFLFQYMFAWGKAHFECEILKDVCLGNSGPKSLGV